MWIHFESFHIIHRPTYMSKYPPAQGLALAIGQILGGHPIVGVWMSFGVMCAAICWMLYGWMTPRWAVLGGILALINPMLGIASYWAQSYWGGAVAASGGALLLGGVRRLVRAGPTFVMPCSPARGWRSWQTADLMKGSFFVFRLVAFLLGWILSKRGPSLAVSFQRIVMPISVVLILIGTAMGLYNFRVTGSALRLPYQVHEETYAVAPVFIWQDLRPEPAYRHREIRDFHADLYYPYTSPNIRSSGFLEKNIALHLGIGEILSQCVCNSIAGSVPID